MKKRIHVNQHHIRINKKEGSSLPVLTCKTYKENIRGNRIAIHQDGKYVAEVIYSPDKPLSCGATVWIETHADVEVL